MSKDQVKNIAREYAKLLRTKKFPFDGVYLFGSFAKGEPHKWSDIDIAVVSKVFSGDDWFEEKAKLWRYVLDVDTRIEPYGISAEEFNEGWSPMASEIKKTGIKIE